MKIVTWNIQFGTGRDGRVDLHRVAGTLEGADIIALQEVDRYWRRSNNVDQPAELKSLLSGYHGIYGAGVDMHGPEGRRQFGNMVFSRAPILYSRHHLLPKLGSNGPISIQRSALECIVDAGGRPLRIISVHLTHLTSETRIPQLIRLRDIVRDAVREGSPVCGDLANGYWYEPGLPLPVPTETLIAGDFNFEPDSPEYQMMTGPASPYGGRVIAEDGFHDAQVLCGHSEDTGVTSDIYKRPVRLDYVFVSHNISSRVSNYRIDNDADGSDHQPIWVDLEWP